MSSARERLCPAALLGPTQLKNIAEPVRVYSWQVGVLAQARPAARAEAAHLSIVVLPFTNLTGDPSQDYNADMAFIPSQLG
jgi:adenylate cyclase